MDKQARLKHTLERALKQPPPLQPAAVLSVDEMAKTCALRLVASGLEVAKARLQAIGTGATEGILIVPAVDSHVLTAQMGEEWIVLLTSEVDKIELRGNAKGGLIDIAKLTEKINEIVDKLNELTKAFNLHQHQGMGLAPPFDVKGDPMAMPPRPPGVISISAAAKLSQDDYENLKVSHA